MRVKRHFGGWAVLSAAIVLVGTLAALLGARAVARSEADKARLAFHLASAEVAATLKLAIQHEEDLVISASAFVAGNPHASPADFDRWAQSVQAMRRYPELQNIGLVALVPASRLAAFESRLAADPVRPLGPRSRGSTGPLQILPPGRRPDYCFAVAGLARSAATYIPAGFDYCALAPRLLVARDSGLISYAPFSDGAGTTLGVSTPMYRAGRPLSTVAQRRRAFVGWLGELITPNVVLERASEGHPDLAARLRYDSSDSHVSFTNGRIPARAQSTTIDLDSRRAAGTGGSYEGWTVQSFGPAVAGGIVGDEHALTLALGGSLLSLLVGLLVALLATGRKRALALVSEKTRELSRQALHDTLTGLPNRALVLDRAAQLLARAARQPGSGIGAMFIDIDGFKQVNDSLGHAAGDQLLETVGERLQSVVRGEDTVGRLGGDEFVALVQIRSDAGTPAGRASAERSVGLLAERLIAALREPVELHGARALSVTASIGIAVGRYATPEAMLRDADLALYAAKAAGKDRYVLFEAGMYESADGPLVLVADDDEINRAVAKALLAKRGLRVEIARDGLQAVRLAVTKDYAAILMDCQMPELDGYEATRRIRAAEHERHVPIIAMTAHSSPDDRQRCLEAGMDEFLSKPVRDQELDAAIRRWLPARRHVADAASGRRAEAHGDARAADGEHAVGERLGDEGHDVLDAATIRQLHETLTPEMRERLMQTFEESLSACLADIADAARRGDEIELRRVAHLLKGSSATLGAKRLRLACQRLQAAADGRQTIEEAQLEQLQAIAAEARSALGVELASVAVLKSAGTGAEDKPSASGVSDGVLFGVPSERAPRADHLR